MNILKIVEGTSVDGPGLRTAIYLSGCSHHCDGCHNPQSWNPDAGDEMTVDEILAVVEDNGFNVTLTGGDPLFNVAQILPLVKTLVDKGYGIWLYTGYTYEDILNDAERAEILNYVDVVVDGPFVSSLRDIKLRFRGSSNQRMVDVKMTQKSGVITLYDDGVN